MLTLLLIVRMPGTIPNLYLAAVAPASGPAWLLRLLRVYDIDFLRDAPANPIRKLLITVFGTSNVFGGMSVVRSGLTLGCRSVRVGGC